MPHTTTMPALGILLAAMWGVQCFAIAMSIYLRAKATDVPPDAWVYLYAQVLIAAVGIGAGLLAARAKPSWKWMAIVSGVAFLAITELSWYLLARENHYLSFLVRNPHVGIGVLIMPSFMLLVSFVAAWRVIRDVAALYHLPGSGT